MLLGPISIVFDIFMVDIVERNYDHNHAMSNMEWGLKYCTARGVCLHMRNM